MRTLSGQAADDLWDKFWDETSEEWFKIEVLQDYTSEDDGPSLRSWLKGDKQASISLLRQEDYSEWIAACKLKLNQGVKLIRVHVIDEPHTPYIDWELQHYKYVNVNQCGELVYLVNSSETRTLNIPNGDVMIFDKNRAVVNSYNARGLVISQTFFDEHDDINQFLELSRQLRKLASPLPNLA